MTGNSYLHIIISSATVYLFIALAIRIFGKKELAQLSVLDIIFVLLISNAVQNAMVGPDTTLTGGLIAAATLFVLNFAFKSILFKSRKLSHLLEGEPVILVSEGKVKDKNMRKVRISTDELLEAVHEHGVQSLRDVNLAILEIDGNISIVSDGYTKRSVKRISRSNEDQEFIAD